MAEKRMIDTDAARRRIIAFATGLHSEVLPVDTVLMLLTQIPTVDGVEVVRCKDCFYWGQRFGEDETFCTHPDGLTSFAYSDDFCSYGEQKEGAN